MLSLFFYVVLRKQRELNFTFSALSDTTKDKAGIIQRNI